MRPGDVVTTTHIRVSLEGGWIDYKADKKDLFVFVYLGATPRNGKNPLDVFQRMNDLGWEMTPEHKALFEEEEEDVSELS